MVTTSNFTLAASQTRSRMLSHDGEDLPGDVAMQRVYESPESGLHRQLGHFEDARQDRVPCDEAQLVQSRKADVETEHDAQHEPVQVHGAGNPLRSQGLFQQGLEIQLVQHGDDWQQSPVGSQIPTIEIEGRRGPDFIGFRNDITDPLIGRPLGRYPVLVR